jgi:hypothetical protein
VQERGAGRPPGAVVLRARRSGTAVSAFLTVLWALALAATVSAQPTAGGKIAGVVIFGVLIAVTVGGWAAVTRRRSQLEVTRDAVVHQKGSAAPVALRRAHGESLRVLPRLSDGSVIRPERLALLGSGGVVSLAGFSAGQVRRACEAHGWRFDGGSELALKDVQRWLHAGRSGEAAQLIELFGPFPDAVADDDAGTSLEAAVLEDYGDKLLRRNRSAARGAYRRAASAQRAFAARTLSADEGAARMARADRIAGKAGG